MLVNIKVTGGLNIESGQIDPKATQGLRQTVRTDIIFFLPFQMFTNSDEAAINKKLPKELLLR